VNALYPRLKLLLWIALAFWVWMLIDLVTHPLTAGQNEGGNLFRWLSGLTGLFTVLTALFIMRRVPGNPVGLLLFLWGVGATGWSLRSEWASIPLGTLATMAFALFFFCISCPAAILLLFHFPDGKPFPPGLARWIPPLTILLAVSGLFYLFGSNPEGEPGNLPNPLYIPALEGTGRAIYLIIFVLGMVAALATLVLRYRAGDARTRLQIRWMAWLLLMGILLAVFWIESLFGTQIALLGLIVSFIFWQSFLALGIGIAILRHNLWDIDVIIRRTLVYGALTATLALVYFGSVVLLQNLVAAVGGQQTAVVTVISTLLIAALFNPLRKRIQNDIDRRFFRKKYDAERVVATFSAGLREEVHLEDLQAQIVTVVEETLQPETVSLWLRPTMSEKTRQRNW